MEFKPETFGELNAEDYDIHHAPDPSDCVAFLARCFDGGGDILELAIGSGRVALPLAAKGFTLHGVEASQEMVDLMRAKPGGDALPVHIGDMADFTLDRTFDHAYLVFNTLLNLTSQAAQIACFQSVARHLPKGGRFVVECFVPDLGLAPGAQPVVTKKVDHIQAWIEASTYDPLTQKLEMQRVRMSSAGTKLVPLVMRLTAPPEMDLMAQLAGFTLEARYADWHNTPFAADSGQHVSVYRLEDARA